MPPWRFTRQPFSSLKINFKLQSNLINNPSNTNLLAVATCLEVILASVTMTPSATSLELTFAYIPLTASCRCLLRNLRLASSLDFGKFSRPTHYGWRYSSFNFQTYADQNLAESHLCIVLEGKVPALEMEVQLDYRNDNKQTIMASRAEACDCIAWSAVESIVNHVVAIWLNRKWIEMN